MDALFAAVDLTTVATFVAAAMLAVIGYKMIFKGQDIASRAIRKA